MAAAAALGWQLLLLLLQLCKPWRPPIPTSLSQLGLGGCSTVLILEEVAESQWRQGVWMLLMGRLRLFLFSSPLEVFTLFSNYWLSPAK